MQFTQRIIDFDWLINNGVEQEPIKSFVLVAHYLKLKAAKMASVQSRFLPATQNTIESLKNSAKNENTRKSTEFLLRVWKKWCEEKEVARDIEHYKPELNNLLERFYTEVRTKEGEDYEPECLKIIMTSLDRNLKENGYAYSIVREREFTSSKQVLEGKTKQLRLASHGKCPNKSRQVTNEEEEELWENRNLGSGNPETLINTMWWLLTQHFGLRGSKNTIV